MDEMGTLSRSVNSQACFICGNLNPIAREKVESHYLRQVELFKTYLPENSDDRVETCSNCWQDVTAVWNLTQQIAVIQRDIATIVEKVTAVKTEGDHVQSRQVMDIEENGPGSLLDNDGTLVFEVKAEINYSEDEDEEHVFESTIPGQGLDEDEIVPGDQFNSSHSLQRKKRRKRPARDPLAFSEDEEEVKVEEKATIVRPPRKGVTFLQKREDCMMARRQVCYLCGVKFRYESVYKIHMDKHIDGQSKVECGICGKQISARTGFKNLVPCLKNHVNNFHPPPERDGEKDELVASWDRSRDRYL